MKWRLLRFEHFLFLVSIGLMALPLLVGPKFWLHDEYGYSMPFPTLSACIYYLIAVLIAGVSGYRSIVSVLLLRRWRQRRDKWRRR